MNHTNQQHQNEEYLDYLAEAFCTEAKKENDKLAVLALVAGAAVWGLSGNAIAGIALGGCVLLYSDRSMRESNRALQAIDQSRIAAPFLESDSFKNFQRQFGNDLVLEQLRLAHEYGLPMQAQAEEYLYEQCPELEEKKPKQDSVPEALPAAPSVTEALPVVDLADRMGQTLKPTIVSAMPRTGKGILLAQAWRAAKRHHPKLKVYVIDPKAHPDESGYWEGCDRVYAQQFHQVTPNCPDTIAELEAFIEEWRADPAAEKLLIFDEQVLVESKLPKWYREYIPGLAKSEGSSGETFQRYLWLVMQSPLVKDIGLSGGSRSIYVFCALATDRQAEGMNPQAWMNSAKASGFIPSIPTTVQFAASPRGTLVYSSLLGGWAAVPEYPVPAPKPTPTPPPKPSSSNWVEPISAPAISDNFVEPIPAPAQVSSNVLPFPATPKAVDPWDAIAQGLISRFKEINQKFGTGEIPANLKPHYLSLKPSLVALFRERRDDLLWIVALSAEKGEITAAMVRERFKRKPWFKQLETATGINDAIRQKFEELESRSIGGCFGEGDRRTFLLFELDERTLTQDAVGQQDAAEAVAEAGL